MTLQALETRPLIRSNRRYRHIAKGKHDPLVLVPREGKQPRRHKRTNPASEAGKPGTCNQQIPMPVSSYATKTSSSR